MSLYGLDKPYYQRSASIQEIQRLPKSTGHQLQEISSQISRAQANLNEARQLAKNPAKRADATALANDFQKLIAKLNSKYAVLTERQMQNLPSTPKALVTKSGLSPAIEQRFKNLKKSMKNFNPIHIPTKKGYSKPLDTLLKAKTTNAKIEALGELLRRKSGSFAKQLIR